MFCCHFISYLVCSKIEKFYRFFFFISFQDFATRSLNLGQAGEVAGNEMLVELKRHWEHWLAAIS